MSNKINNIKRILYSSLEEKRLGRALAQIALIASGASAERLSEIKENYERRLADKREIIAQQEEHIKTLK